MLYTPCNTMSEHFIHHLEFRCLSSHFFVYLRLDFVAFWNELRFGLCSIIWIRLISQVDRRATSNKQSNKICKKSVELGWSMIIQCCWVHIYLFLFSIHRQQFVLHSQLTSLEAISVLFIDYYIDWTHKQSVMAAEVRYEYRIMWRKNTSSKTIDYACKTNVLNGS